MAVEFPTRRMVIQAQFKDGVMLGLNRPVT
jgi:hypothetical protein